MDKYIEEVGPHNVVQICTDNASSMKAAVDIITDRYSYIYFQGCDESVVGRLGEGDVDERGQHMPLAVFSKHEEKLSLLMSRKTRFGLNFLMVDRLLQVRTALE
jgi:hypothetical protein